MEKFLEKFSLQGLKENRPMICKIYLVIFLQSQLLQRVSQRFHSWPQIKAILE
jgi:hypothetical protein